MKLCLFIISVLVVIIINAELNNNQFLNFNENETAIQLKLFDNPIRLDQNTQLNDKALFISLQYLDASNPNSVWESNNVTVSRLIPDQSKFVNIQAIEYKHDTMITYFLNTTKPEATHFRLLIKNNNTIHNFDDFYAIIPPFQMDETSGVRNVSLIDSKLNIPIGDVRVLFLVVRPMKEFVNGPTIFDIEPDNGFNNLTLIGHRGTGVSVRRDVPQHFIENTIDAFNYVCDHGADMIELDVQLTSDGIPVIYHDFSVTTFLPKRNFHHLSENFTFKIPLKDLSKKQLDMINTNFMPSSQGQSITHQSFETLEDVLKGIRSNCGINVEIKYPQMFNNGHWDGERGVELNKYVDSILTVLNRYHNHRKIVITSFHPDLCVMVQLKQKRFHVAFLTSGDSSINDPNTEWIWDPRGRKVDKNVAFAVAANFHGLSLLALDVQTYPTNIRYIKDRNLSLYLWGSQINSWQIIQKLYNAGVNGFIFDHLDKIVPKH